MYVWTLSAHGLTEMRRGRQQYYHIRTKICTLTAEVTLVNLRKISYNDTSTDFSEKQNERNLTLIQADIIAIFALT